MFKRKTKDVTIDGVKMKLVELSKKTAFQVDSLQDASERTTLLFRSVVHQPDGSPFFADDAAVDDLPSSVVVQIGSAIKELNDAKK